MILKRKFQELIKIGLDKFYTQQEIATECIQLVPELDSYDLIIEPSAGTGSFSSQIKNCLAYDLEPAASNIEQKDWLSTKPFSANHVLVIGNPPFGPRSSVAKQFIKHSQKIGAETIAFILPDTFSKLTNQSKTLFPENWSLIIEHKLTNCNFKLENGNDYYVPCSFYIWTKRPSSINLRQIKLTENKDFSFLPRGSEDADFSINGNSGKVKNINEITNSKAEHYIKAKDKSIEELKEIFSHLNYTTLSSVNGGNYWLGQQDILKAYNNYIKGE